VTWDQQLYLPSEGRHAEDFFAMKNLTASAGFEPEASMLTLRLLLLRNQLLICYVVMIPVHTVMIQFYSTR
jgi:hypothetical protein